MLCQLIIVRYPRYLFWAGFLSMAFFRPFLWWNSSISFWKLMGCGRNGTFDVVPDARQWALMLVPANPDNLADTLPRFFLRWWHFFRAERYTLTLQPIEGHGTWDGKEVFGTFEGKEKLYNGRMAVLTRATIRPGKLLAFWKHVAPVASMMATAPGFITSVGIGEVPWLKQATFSVWESKELMQQFAYKRREHSEVIKKTRSDRWYSEDMFVRFSILSTTGTLRGIDPLALRS
jgi:hypothetical protein